MHTQDFNQTTLITYTSIIQITIIALAFTTSILGNFHPFNTPYFSPPVDPNLVGPNSFPVRRGAKHWLIAGVSGIEVMMWIYRTVQQLPSGDVLSPAVLTTLAWVSDQISVGRLHIGVG